MFSQDFNDFEPFMRGRGGFGPNFDDLEDKLRFAGLRIGRGMMEPAILSALREKSMHGYEIISYLEERSHGAWRPSPGSVYPTLQLLEEKDLIACRERDGKKIYSLTTQGAAEADQADADLRQAFETMNDRARADGRAMNLRHQYQRHFHRRLGDNMKLMRTIFRKGTPLQKQAMDDALVTLHDSLEQIAKGMK